MEQIKSAFSKVKQDIQNINSEISLLKDEIKEIKNLLTEFYDSLNQIKYNNLNNFTEKTNPTIRQINPTIRQINPTYVVTPTDTPTLPQELKGLKSSFLNSSTGNEGVPTDTRQTDRQIPDRYSTDKITNNITNNIESNIKEASQIINSFDKLKKEIRNKFKQLTSQEMLVFSTIYELEEKDPKNTTYNNISSLLNLSEGSIRDYIFKMIKKGIPIKKTKINNRKIILSISNELKKIASLSTIIQLREIQ